MLNQTELECLKLYFNDIKNLKPLKKDDEYNLAKTIREEGEGYKQAIERIIKANLRFVVSVARNYQNQGLSLEDLIAEGNLGLIRAVREFDERKNFKFISYAVWWVRQSILKALAEQSRIVQVPLNRIVAIGRVNKVQEKFEQKYGRKPDFLELCMELKISSENIKLALETPNSHVSLDKPVSGDSDLKLIDCLEDEEAEKSDESITNRSMSEALKKILNCLPENERNIVGLYFGIGHETNFTLEEIGKKFNITRERVRQIKEKGLRRLRTFRSKFKHIEYDKVLEC